PETIQEWAKALGVLPAFVDQQIGQIRAGIRRKAAQQRLAKIAPKALSQGALDKRYSELQFQFPPYFNRKSLWPMANDFPDFPELGALGRKTMPVEEARAVVLARYRPAQAVDLASVLGAIDPRAIAGFADRKLPSDEGTALLAKVRQQTAL